MPFDVPPLVRQKALRLGRPGRQWLAELPDILAGLLRDWSLTAVEPLAGGSASAVVRVRTADGLPAVLKVSIPDGDIVNQIRTITDARGQGYVTLLAHDAARDAMLLEALGPSLETLDWPPERQLEILSRLLRQAWQVPGTTTEPPLDKAGQLGRLVAGLWEKLAQPCSERVVTDALRFARRRADAVTVADCVVVHGDPHPGNALRATTPRAGAESGFVFVDPDGFLADPAYDCGVVLRDWCSPLLAGDAVPLARRYCRLLADGTGVDETAIWEWGFLERVSSGLYALDLGAEAVGRRLLDTAERLSPGS